MIDKPEKELPVAKFGRDSVLPTCWYPSSIIHALGNVSKTEEMEIDAKTQIIYLFGAIRLIFFGWRWESLNLHKALFWQKVRSGQKKDMTYLISTNIFILTVSGGWIGTQAKNRCHAIRAWICIRDQALYICDGQE